MLFPTTRAWDVACSTFELFYAFNFCGVKLRHVMDEPCGLVLVLEFFPAEQVTISLSRKAKRDRLNASQLAATGHLIPADLPPSGGEWWEA